MTRSRVFAETSQHSTGDHSGAVFVNSSGGHASMRCLDNHRDSLRLQHFLNNVSYLHRKAFLNLQASSKGVHDSRDLRYSDDATIWQISHVGDARNRCQVMLTK